MHTNYRIKSFFYLLLLLMAGCGSDSVRVDSLQTQPPPKSPPQSSTILKDSSASFQDSQPEPGLLPVAHLLIPVPNPKHAVNKSQKIERGRIQSETLERFKSDTHKKFKPEPKPEFEIESDSEESETVERRMIPGVNQPNTPDLHLDGIHDPDNPALAVMQNPSQPLSALPMGKWREIDWMKALAQNAIQPRATLHGEGTMQVLDLDIILTDTKSMPHVRFPHLAHTKWLDCSNCHPDIFLPQKGMNDISMDSIFKGRFCGTCHGKVAFSNYICQRCHNVPHAGSPSQWWK